MSSAKVSQEIYDDEYVEREERRVSYDVLNKVEGMTKKLIKL